MNKKKIEKQKYNQAQVKIIVQTVQLLNKLK